MLSWVVTAQAIHTAGSSPKAASLGFKSHHYSRAFYFPMEGLRVFITPPSWTVPMISPWYRLCRPTETPHIGVLPAHRHPCTGAPPHTHTHTLVGLDWASSSKACLSPTASWREAVLLVVSSPFLGLLSLGYSNQPPAGFIP